MLLQITKIFNCTTLCHTNYYVRFFKFSRYCGKEIIFRDQENFSSQRTQNTNFFGIENDNDTISFNTHKISEVNDKKTTKDFQEKFHEVTYGIIRCDSENTPVVHGQYGNKRHHKGNVTSQLHGSVNSSQIKPNKNVTLKNLTYNNTELKFNVLAKTSSKYEDHVQHNSDDNQNYNGFLETNVSDNYSVASIKNDLSNQVVTRHDCHPNLDENVEINHIEEQFFKTEETSSSRSNNRNDTTIKSCSQKTDKNFETNYIDKYFFDSIEKSTTSNFDISYENCQDFSFIDKEFFRINDPNCSSRVNYVKSNVIQTDSGDLSHENNNRLKSCFNLPIGMGTINNCKTKKLYVQNNRCNFIKKFNFTKKITEEKMFDESLSDSEDSALMVQNISESVSCNTGQENTNKKDFFLKERLHFARGGDARSKNVLPPHQPHFVQLMGKEPNIKKVYSQNSDLLDSKGFRILKNQVPDFSLLTRGEIVKILRNNILYLDDDLMILNKVYNLVIHDSQSAHHPCLSQVVDELAQVIDPQNPRPKLYTVHRLDKETTGCLLLARNETAAHRFKTLFSQRRILKRYWIVTAGVPSPLKGVIDIPIAEGAVHNKKRMVLQPDLSKEVHYESYAKNGKPAVTSYQVLSISGNAALVEVYPLTGIKHQIRVHFGFGMLCPILGDHKYSHLDKMAPQKLSSDLLQRLHVRQAKVRHIPVHLHAYSVTIPNYLSGRDLIVSAPLPYHMVANLKKLKFKKKNKLKL